MIHKYPLRADIWNEIVLTKNAKVLSVQIQDEQLVMWAEFDPYIDEKETREFWVNVTGMLFSTENAIYLGTFQRDWFVGHVYERLKGVKQ